MGNIAFVFAGQGAQAPGMGREFFECSESAREVFCTADAVRPGTSDQCFYSDDTQLQKTINTQPCLYTVEMAIAAAVTSAGIKADMCAGFSLGELSALTYAGVLSLSEGLKAVNARAQLMQEDALKHETSMAAVIKLSNDQIDEICRTVSNVYPVNYNCPGQTSVSGDSAQMLEFAEAVKAAGGRAKFLKVNGAFHSPYMSGAAEGFRSVLEGITFSEPVIPVYSNYTGSLYEINEIAENLSSQINNPVRWETIVRNMISRGADVFVELGPGKTLTGLIKRIDPDVKLINVSVPADLEKLKEELL